MTREQITAQLTPIAQRVFANDKLVLTDDLSAANTPTWTSLAFMQFLTEIEQHFGFKFKIMEILKLQTMGAILTAIEQHTC